MNVIYDKLLIRYYASNTFFAKSKMNLERPFFHDSSRYNKNSIRALSHKP